MKAICPTCKGKQAVRECDDPEPHKHHAKCGWLLCPTCDGVGTVERERVREEVAA